MMVLAKNLGYDPILLPFKPNGKPQHVKGFIAKFAKTAKSTADFLNELDALDIAMVGMDASLALCYRDEYNQILGEQRGDFNVLLAHEWLVKVIKDIDNQQFDNDTAFKLFAHCTEKTALPKSEQEWQSIFAHFGLTLDKVAVGCCGMAGTYGHEASNLDNSKGLFEMSWQGQLDSLKQEQVVVTGFSCRSQAKRFANIQSRHPVEVLAELTS